MKISGKTLEILLFLSSRHRDEFSGYEVGKTLSIASGTLYPLLVKLKQAGMVEDRWEAEEPTQLGRPRRRYYKITGLGMRAIEERMRVLDANYEASSVTGGFSEPVTSRGTSTC